MDPAEEIVTSWLNQRGYFVINGVKCKGNKEIDILAVNPVTGDKLHVEVSVSIRPFGGFSAWSDYRYRKEPLPDRIRCFCLSKFIGIVDEEIRELKNRFVEERVMQLMGTEDYRKILVIGNLHESDPKDEFERELKKHRVELVSIRDVVTEVVEDMSGVYMDNARRYLQVFSIFSHVNKF